jgi:phospholipase/carboxylesterase
METEGPLSGSVIWLHGLGASNHDFDDLVPELGIPGIRYIFPAAPVRRVTINGGYPMPAWYDILSLANPPLREQEADVRASAAEIEELIAREVDRGVASERIALIGFSQGGAMALHTALRHDDRLAGVAVLSAYLVLPDSFESERRPGNAQIPLLFCHGKSDDVVPRTLGMQAYERCRAAGYPAAWHEFPMAHSICLEEVLILREWLQARFGPKAESRETGA